MKVAGGVDQVRLWPALGKFFFVRPDQRFMTRPEASTKNDL